jgi:hypothetical protein
VGCLTRIGCATVLVVGGVAGYWLYGDRLPSVLGRAARGAADKVTDVAARGSERLDSPEGARIAAEESARRQAERERRDRELGWVSVTKAAAGTDAKADLATLRRKSGPAYVSLSASDVAGLLAPLLAQLPPSASAIELAMNRDLLLVRTDVQLRDFAGEGAFGSVIGAALDGHDTLFLAGPFEPVRPGLAQFRVRELRIKGIDVPTRVIPSLVGALRRRARYKVQMEAGLAPDGLPVPLPTTVSDVRVVNGRLTLYRAQRGASPSSTP